jgi:hypothetical protein
VREIGGGEVGGLMHLTEDRELPRSVAGPPLPDPPLERASMGIEELAGMLLAEPVEECLGQELGFVVQLRLDFGPDRSEGVDAGAVGPRRLLADAGERGVVAIMTGGLVGHPCPPGRVGQRGSLVEQMPQRADLTIRDHRRPPRSRELPMATSLSGGNSNCRWKGVLIAAQHTRIRGRSSVRSMSPLFSSRERHLPFPSHLPLFAVRTGRDA